MPKDTQRTITTDQALDHLPERVIVAVAELASAAREGLEGCANSDVACDLLICFGRSSIR